MAGIHHQAAERYRSELTRRGFSVAFFDQLDVTPAKGPLLKHHITRVLTPGTVLEASMLDAVRPLVEKTEQARVAHADRR